MGPERVLTFEDRESGLAAVLVIDSTALGPAAGGVRTFPYRSLDEAREDAAGLARTMTIKCALAGLAAGGGKCAVLEHPGLDRPAAFRRLGERIEALGGAFRTAGDLGTTASDLAAMATTCRYVHTDEGELAAAVARSVLACARACAALLRGDGALSGLRAAVQGCGKIGAAVARALAVAGAKVVVADVDPERAASVAAEIAGEVAPPEAILTLPVDLLLPCAAGGVITEAVARDLRAAAVCGAANRVLASPAAARLLLERRVLQVPDVLASAGAVIEGIGRTVMNLPDRGPAIDVLGTLAREVLEESRAQRTLPDEIARERAEERIRGA